MEIHISRTWEAKIWKGRRSVLCARSSAWAAWSWGTITRGSWPRACDALSGWPVIRFLSLSEGSRDQHLCSEYELLLNTGPWATWSISLSVGEKKHVFFSAWVHVDTRLAVFVPPASGANPIFDGTVDPASWRRPWPTCPTYSSWREASQGGLRCFWLGDGLM